MGNKNDSLYIYITQPGLACLSFYTLTIYFMFLFLILICFKNFCFFFFYIRSHDDRFLKSLHFSVDFFHSFLFLFFLSWNTNFCCHCFHFHSFIHYKQQLFVSEFSFFFFFIHTTIEKRFLSISSNLKRIIMKQQKQKQ